jgi:hypothetical protein
MESERFFIKLYAQQEKYEVDQVIPVFHRWIRERVSDELLIDVASYSHVERGPGVLLVGHAIDYYLDEQDDRVGIVFSRKRSAPPPGERLRDGFKRLFKAAELLEQASELSPPLKFKTNEVLLRCSDRLNAPNTDAAFDKLKGELESFGTELYGEKPSVTRAGTAGELLSAKLTLPNAPALAELVKRVG